MDTKLASWRAGEKTSPGSMAEPLGTAGSAVEGERPSGLALAKCEGLPRVMLESGRIPDHVFERMDYLWKASNRLILESPAVSRMYSDQLRKLCAQYEALSPGDGPLLPEWVSDSLCSACGGVLTPGVNCRVRVRHRSLASPSVKRAKAKVHGKKKAKCLNEVVTTCLVCGGINARGGTERRAHDKKRRRRGGGERRHATGLREEDNETPAGKKRTRVATNLRGNFIPLWGTSSARVATKTNTLVESRTPSRAAPPSSKRGSSHRDRGARSNGNDGGKSESKSRSREEVSVSRVGLTSRVGSDAIAPQAERTAADVAGHLTEEGRSGNRDAGNNGLRQSIGGSYGGSREDPGMGEPARNVVGDTSGGILYAGGGGGGEGNREPRAPPPALSLLERIRRDTKKKRRKDAAATAAAAAAVGQKEQR